MKVLASDFDLTLFIEGEEEIILKNINAISNFIKSGHLFCIVTGRNYSDIKAILNQYHIPYHYLVCADGAQIFDYNDYCFYRRKIKREIVEKIIPIAESEQFSYYLDDGYNVTNNMDDCIKVVFHFDDPEKASSILKKIQSSVPTYSYISRKHINILDVDVNKQKALRKIMELEKLDLSNLYVIGDSVNDLEMLQTFQGAIMKNHTKELCELDKKQYLYLYEYIEELGKN